MFEVYDATGVPFKVDAEHWRAGTDGVVFTDSRGKIIDSYTWDEISDINIERVNG